MSSQEAPNLSTVRHYLAQEHGLAVVSTVQSDGGVLSTVVNCGVIDHPVTGDSRVGLVSVANAARLRHIRRGSPVTVTVRRDWRWVSVSGPAELIGPDDNASGLDADAIRILLRDVFIAAGGTHDDWDVYDETVRAEGRTAVLVTPTRIRGNG